MKSSRNSKEQRRDNAFNVLNIIRNNKQGVTRKQITEKTGLSYPSVNDIVNYLDSFGFLETFEGEGDSRKKVPCYRFSGGNYRVLGLSIIPRKIIGVCCDLEGNILNRFEENYDEIQDRFPETVLARFRKIKTDMDKAGTEVLGLGIGAPGLLNPKEGIIRYAAQFHELEGLNLKETFSKGLNLPVFLEHNPNLSAFAEKRIGAAQDLSNFLYVILDSGIGGCLFHGNRLFRGSSPFLGELGHSSVHYDGPLCQCGNHGCLELYAGYDVLNKRMEACSNKEEGEKILDEVSSYIGSSISNLVSFLGICNIIFCGKSIREYPELFYKTRQFLLTRTLPVFEPDFNIKQTSLEHDASPLGAALWMGEIALSNLSSQFFPMAPDLDLKLDGVMKSSM